MNSKSDLRNLRHTKELKMKTERLGELIRFHRKNKGWNVKQFIELLGGSVSPSFISQIEIYGAIPSPELICKIAGVINCLPKKLLDLAKAEKLDKYEKSLDANYTNALNEFNERS